jgi:outer membrane biosynthesis protein TonB
MSRQRQIGCEHTQGSSRRSALWRLVFAAAMPIALGSLLFLRGLESVAPAAEPAAKTAPEVSASPSDQPVPKVAAPEPPAASEVPSPEVQKAPPEIKPLIRERRWARYGVRRGHGCPCVHLRRG